MGLRDAAQSLVEHNWPLIQKTSLRWFFGACVFVVTLHHVGEPQSVLPVVHPLVVAREIDAPDVSW